MGKVIAHIALGANLGEKGDTLLRALDMLNRREGVAVRRISQFIQTAAIGGDDDQPVYINAAAELETTLSPDDLLTMLLEVESVFGRDRTRQKRWAPRTCDLDLLLVGDIIMKTEALTLPHPRLHERSFVLQPLAQIAPQAMHPVLKKTIAELLAELEKGT